MTEQATTRSRDSRFAGVLFKTDDNSYKIISIFFLQFVIFFIVASFTSSLWNMLSTGSFNFEYMISSRRLLFIMTELCALWGIVYLIGHFNKNFYKHLLPNSFVRQFGPAEEFSSFMQDAFDKEISYTDREVALSNKLRAIAAIDLRISSLRTRANLMLSIAGVLLVGASIIVIFAGTLTNLDASAVSNVDKIAKDISDTEKRLARLSQVEELKKSALTDASAAKKLSALTDLDSAVPISDKGIASAIADEQQRLSQSQALIKTAWEKELTSARGYNDTRYIIATAITRIGVLLVVIFLAQVLIGLYRYNTKLVTFYNSRRDLFQIWDGKGANIDKLQKLMVPNVDFGREPKHPLEEVIRQVLAKVHLTGVPIAGTDESSLKK